MSLVQNKLDAALARARGRAVALGAPCACYNSVGASPETTGPVNCTDDDDDDDSHTCEAAQDTIDTCVASPVQAVSGDESMKLVTISLEGDDVHTDSVKLLRERAVAERMLKDLEAEASSTPLSIPCGVYKLTLGAGLFADEENRANWRHACSLQHQVLMLVEQRELLERRHAQERDLESVKIMMVKS